MKYRLTQEPTIRIALNQRYSEGDIVNTPDGIGVVTGILTETAEAEGETIEASSDSPTYVVILEDEDTQFGTYKASDLEADEIETEIDDPTEDIAETADNRDLNPIDVFAGTFSANQDGFFEWPQSWVDSDTPARVIALKALSGMGGSFDGCVREMRGNIASPDRFCADFLDRVYGNPYWRGDSPLPGD